MTKSVGAHYWLPFLVLALLAAPSAHAADACDHPEAAICAGPPPSHPFTGDQIRSEANLAMGSASYKVSTADPGRSPGGLAEFVKYIGKIYGSLLKHFATLGISSADIEAKVATIRAGLVKSTQDEKMGNSPPGGGPSSSAEVAKKIGSVKLLDPATFLASPESQSDIIGYYTECGADGMVSQAYYSSTKNHFVMCPGYLLDVLNSGSLDALDFTVGHEMSHSVDAERSEDYPRYKSYLSCVQKNYGTELGSVPQISKELGAPAQARLKALVAHLKSLPGDHSADIQMAQFRMQDASNRVGALGWSVHYLAGVMGHAPNQAETHSGELSADFGGMEALIQSLKAMPKERRAGAVKNSMGDFCLGQMDPSYVTLFGPLKGDDGLHPPLSFRLKILMSNPEVRLLLGCKNLNPPTPWCSVSEAAPIAARCTRQMGITSATDCERVLSMDLKASGCSFQNLQCEPFDGTDVGCCLDSPNCHLPSQKAGFWAPACNDRSRDEKLFPMDPPLPVFCVKRTVVAPGETESVSHASEAR